MLAERQPGTVGTRRGNHGSANLFPGRHLKPLPSAEGEDFLALAKADDIDAAVFTTVTLPAKSHPKRLAFSRLEMLDGPKI